jgi:DNA-binding NarL/FixJ family response regulator
VEEMIKVLIVDDHSIFRHGLVALLSLEKQLKVVGQASDGYEAMQRAGELAPDLIIMDVQMPGCNGVEATRSIRENGFSGSILMLTVSDREDDLFAAIKAGANGYLLKNVEPEELIDAITHVARGEAIISPIMATKLLGEFKLVTGRKAQRTAEPETSLSEREEEILRLVAKGASNKDVASSLFITENTVKCHMRNIMGKLHLKNRYEAIAYAVRNGLAPVGEKPKDDAA